MKRWPFAVGAIVLAAALVWLVLRGYSSREPPAPVQQAPARVAFHVSKPLDVTVAVQSSTRGADAEWLERELRYALVRGKMRVAPAHAKTPDLFTLRVEIGPGEPSNAKLALVASDGYVEHETQVALADAASRLDTIRKLTNALPDLLGVMHNKAAWGEFIGTQDAASYDSYLRSAAELFGSSGRGFSKALPTARAQTVDRLEVLTRRQPQFARAWSALALAYLSLGGEDIASLAELAESGAERALAIEPGLADAQSALGLLRLYRNEWALAKEHFDAALAADPNSIAALEGLACLLVDVGHHQAALPFASRAVTLQPKNAGAQECLIYAQFALGAPPPVDPSTQAFAAARVRALIALLSKDINSARRLLRNSQDAQGSSWIDPLLRAAENRRHIAEALREITRAANELEIDPVTEIVAGAALKQADFVFNRMLRLRRKNEAVPLRLLWLQQTAFLRQHPQFEQVVSSAGLPPFWQDEGPPDLCASEPPVPWCGVKKMK